MDPRYVRFRAQVTDARHASSFDAKIKGGGGEWVRTTVSCILQHALCQLSCPATRLAAPFRNLAQCSIRYVLRRRPSSKKNITKREHFSHLKMRTGGRSKNPSMAVTRDSGPSQSEHLGGAVTWHLFYTELTLFCCQSGFDSDCWSDSAGGTGSPPWFRKRPRV
jgi:hypothetical protein